jgi:5-formyltetrahydrofolate cyclo-ligase
VDEDDRSRKDELRKRQRALRDGLSAADAARSSAEVCRLVAALPALGRAARVALYAALPGEVDPAALEPLLAAPLYPRVAEAGRGLSFHRARLVDLQPGRYRLREPRPEAAAVSLSPGDVVLVPGLAFDRNGARLGWGMGHYDVALATARGALRIGLGHGFQLVDAVPEGPGDERMDLVVTPHGVVSTGARAGFVREAVS